MRVIRADTIVFIPASHEPSVDPNVVKKVLADKEILNSGRVQMVNWARMAPGRSFCKHYHEDMQEMFVIIKGRARADVEGSLAELSSGDAIIIEPCEVHVMTNTGPCDLEYIAIGISQGRGGKTVVV
jgi:mannose-6-phosphate isomerase-like protein (cupin superfamily)